MPGFGPSHQTQRKAMKTNWKTALLLGCVIGLGTPYAAQAEESLPALTRKVFNENKDAIVWVSGVAKLSFSAADSKTPLNIPDQERKFESLGTVIDAGGMVVTSLSTIDPAREVSGREYNTQSGRVRIEAAAKLNEVKIVMGDGTEVPADVVMKDTDLDLAFVRPRADSKEAKSVTFKWIDLAKSTTCGIADDTVTVVRMNEALNRQPGVQGGQVVAIAQKPRTFLGISGGALGCPTFAMDGKIIGLTVMRILRDRGPATVVLPAADVLEVAEQAKTAKPAATQPAE